jgi:hypothetical protein
MDHSPWICRHCFTGNDSVASACQGCKKVRDPSFNESLQSSADDQEPKDWMSAVRGFGAVFAGVILGSQLIGSEPQLLTFRSSLSPVLLSSWQLAFLGFTAIVASVVLAADIFASDLRSKSMPAFTRSKSWRVTIRLIWLAFLLLLIAFLASQANVTPAPR